MNDELACAELHPLLAGYVDEELSSDERQRVEEHLEKCPECRAQVEEQRAAATVYAQYPVEEPTEGQWQRVWMSLGSRLPARARRVSLESLTDLDVSGELMEQEEEAVPRRKSPALGTGPLSEVVERARRVRPMEGPREEPVFKPIRMPRLKHMVWAHVAGLAAAAAIMVLVLVSVKPPAQVGPVRQPPTEVATTGPVIRTDQLAAAGQYEIDYGVADSNDAPVPYVLQTDTGRDVLLIWASPSAGSTEGRRSPNES